LHRLPAYFVYSDLRESSTHCIASPQSIKYLDCLKQPKLESENQDEKITLLELQNKKQDDGIDFLKNDMAENCNQIGRMSKLFNGKKDR